MRRPATLGRLSLALRGWRSNTANETCSAEHAWARVRTRVYDIRNPVLCTCLTLRSRLGQDARRQLVKTILDKTRGGKTYLHR